MLCNIDAAAEPDAFEPVHVLEQPNKPSASSRPSDQPVVRANGEQFREAFLTFAVENVERVTHVGEPTERSSRSNRFYTKDRRVRQARREPNAPWLAP